MKSFRQMTEDGTIKRADAMKIRLEDLHEEPGFNLRLEGEALEASIQELAEYLAAGGGVPPLEVRPRAEGGVWIVDGHRRQRAYNLLDAAGRLPRVQDKKSGKLEAWIEVRAFEGNDADRVARIISSQQNEKLGPLEIAEGYRRLKAFGWTEAQIATRIGKSAEHVRQQLQLINEADSDVQTLVRDKKVSASVAIKTVKEHGDKAGAVLKDALATLPEGKKVTAKALKPTTVVRSKKVCINLWERLVASYRVLAQADNEPTSLQWAEADEIVKELENV